MTKGNETLKTHKPNGYGHETFDNLTKREYFAALALQGILANPDAVIEPWKANKELVGAAVATADALIESLNEKQGE